jgi:hypothetical protein
LAIPSPLPSRPSDRQVEGMNCIGPTARSHTMSPSQRPPSVSWIAALFAAPFSTGPRMVGVTSPVGLKRAALPKCRPWLDSMRPMPASTLQGGLQFGSKPAAQLCAKW